MANTIYNQVELMMMKKSNQVYQSVITALLRKFGEGNKFEFSAKELEQLENCFVMAYSKDDSVYIKSFDSPEEADKFDQLEKDGTFKPISYDDIHQEKMKEKLKQEKIKLITKFVIKEIAEQVMDHMAFNSSL